jgi:phospholipase/lecithinase/hemolysin
MQIKRLVCGLAAIVLTACGGQGAPGKPAVKFSRQITFGDGLSDTGSYAVGTVADLQGGKFTINGDHTKIDAALTGKIWVENIASSLGLQSPCAAQTGLDGDPKLGMHVPVVNHSGCFNYAQGGARVTDPIGPGNAATGSPVGALTVPIVTQVANHLAAVKGHFKGDEIVFVMAGENDALMLLDESNAGQGAIDKMRTVADQLADLVLTQIVAKGAKYVVVNNLQNLSDMPGALNETSDRRALETSMVTAFNQRLQDKLKGESKVLYVDMYALSYDQVRNPGKYGLSNVTTRACRPTSISDNALLCNLSNILQGPSIAHYMFADDLHPTPFEDTMVANEVLARMKEKGWY